MTHTLHRAGVIEESDELSLSQDFVVLAMPAKDINHVGSGPKLRQFLEMSLKYDPVNLGDCRKGNEWWQGSREIMFDNVEDRAVVHAVFNDRQKVVAFLRDLKEAELGICVIISGIFETTKECCRQAGLKPHTENRSLYVWGRKELLPDENILGITTMCGHAMVTPRLVEQMVERIKKGRATPEEAALELAKPCQCAIFNIERAARILKMLSESA